MFAGTKPASGIWCKCKAIPLFSGHHWFGVLIMYLCTSRMINLEIRPHLGKQ